MAVSRLARMPVLTKRTMWLLTLPILFAAACLAGWLLLFPRGPARPGRRRAMLLGAGIMALVAGPPLVIGLARPRRSLPGFGDAVATMDPLVEALLQGDQLVPPQPLPPLMFATAEVTLIRPMLALADRDWKRLDASFAQRLLVVFQVMRERHGYEMILLEGYRSPERQERLAAAGPHVSNARAFQSYHQHGLAADCAFVREGQLVISERDPWAMRGYSLYGEVAESLGMVWGGRWAMMDFGHTELRKGGAGA